MHADAALCALYKSPQMHFQLHMPDGEEVSICVFLTSPDQL